MRNIEIENGLYTYFGQCIIDSLTDSKIEYWDKGVLHIGIGNGIKNFKLIYEYQGNSNNVRLVQKKLNNAIEELISLTNSDMYKKWNRLRFELSSGHQFNVDYLWDEEIEKNYQILLSPRWK